MKQERIEPAAPLAESASRELTPALASSGGSPGDRHDAWTPQKQAAFLRALAGTHCVSTAARRVGMGRQSAYKLRARLRGEPFDIAWQAAFRLQYDALLEATVERAIHGVEVPHFHNGELIHTSRRFDERAAVALLTLRERMAPLPRSHGAEYEQIGVEEFDTLVARVEYGDEVWDAAGYPEDDCADDEA